MIELSTHIEYMLLDNSEVGVPQLGTFTVREMPSRRVDEEGIFLPPYRSVSFCQNELEEGEDFALSLAKTHNLTLQEARMACSEYAFELQQTLREEGTFGIGSMGFLLCDAQSGTVSFMPMQSGIASPAYYGLDAIDFVKLCVETRQQRDKYRSHRTTKVTTVDSDDNTIIIRINRRLFNYVATVAASAALFFIFTSPLNIPTANNEQQKADTELFLPTKMLPIAQQKPEQEANESASVDAEDRTLAEQTVEATATSVIKESVTPDHTSSPIEGYSIVIASAIPVKSAVSYAAKLQEKGYKAIACKIDGMTRVIIPGFESKDAAYAEIRQMRQESQEFANVWPCLFKEKTVETIVDSAIN